MLSVSPCAARSALWPGGADRHSTQADEICNPVVRVDEEAPSLPCQTYRVVFRRVATQSRARAGGGSDFSLVKANASLC